jgi:hypothetical protein
MGRVTMVGLHLALAMVLASPLSGQEPAKHRGFWIGFGLGGGWNLTRNVGVDQRTAAGGAAYLRLGGTPSQSVLLGGEIMGWGREEDGNTLSRGNANFTVMFYPSVDAGVYLKGGLGGASISTTVEEGNTTTTVHDEGFGATVGLGWDVRLGRNFYLTPAVDFLYQRVSDSDNTIVLLTLGAMWH